jgi:hypothetical protein
MNYKSKARMQSGLFLLLVLELARVYRHRRINGAELRPAVAENWRTRGGTQRDRRRRLDPRIGFIVLADGSSSIDVAFDHQIIFAADEQEMLDVVPANDDQPAAFVDFLIFGDAKALPFATAYPALEHLEYDEAANKQSQYNGSAYGD